MFIQNEICAFKITSEAQTIQLMLQAPGKISDAKLGRDLESYDLGQEVYDIIKDNFWQGKKFIQQILVKRTQHFPGHPAPNLTPTELLGDVSLDEIAENIVNYKDQKGNKNRIYHGISALVGLCVGDIGEVITLYERMLRKYNGTYPIPAEEQSANFRNISSTALWHLGKVEANMSLRDYAITFADTAHELLKKSNSERPDKNHRLRQYYSIYVDISKGKSVDTTKLYNQLVALIDAGIFVFSGGSNSPRTTNRFTNPLNQFVLIYRKLYGITNLIGLVHGDRFELNGEQLLDWLENPKNGKEILKKGLGTGEYKRKDNLSNQIFKRKKKKRPPQVTQSNLFDKEPQRKEIKKYPIKNYIQEKLPLITKITDPFQLNFDKAILGLGFEERTEASADKVLELRPKFLQLIEYGEVGRRDTILDKVKESGIPFEIVKYEEVDNLEVTSGNVLVDVSGLSKNLIFHSVFKEFKNNRKIFIIHTRPKVVLPRDKDVQEILKLRDSDDNLDFEFLQHLTSELAKGEQGPYTAEKLYEINVDETNPRLLVAFSTSKYERVLKVLEERDFDFIQLVSPISRKPKNELARIASTLITRRFNYSNVAEFNTNDMQKFLSFLSEKYFQFHILNGYNIEFVFTGSKRQTVISAIVSSLFQVSKCWYVRPKVWDTKNFSKGVGETEYFEISFN